MYLFFSFYAFLLVSINMLDIMLQQPANFFLGFYFLENNAEYKAV